MYWEFDTCNSNSNSDPDKRLQSLLCVHVRIHNTNTNTNHYYNVALLCILNNHTSYTIHRFKIYSCWWLMTFWVKVENLGFFPRKRNYIGLIQMWKFTCKYTNKITNSKSQVCLVIHIKLYHIIDIINRVHTSTLALTHIAVNTSNFLYLFVTCSYANYQLLSLAIQAKALNLDPISNE